MDRRTFLPVGHSVHKGRLQGVHSSGPQGAGEKSVHSMAAVGQSLAKGTELTQEDFLGRRDLGQVWEKKRGSGVKVSCGKL